MIRRFCPKCGKQTNELIEGFCSGCYTGKRKFIEVPEEIKIQQCKNCNSILLKGRWVRFDLQKLKDFVKSKIDVSGLKSHKVSLAFLENIIKVHVTGRFGDKVVEKEYEIPFRVNFGTCDYCVKKNADYWQARVQLRKEKHFDYDLYEKLKYQLSTIADFEQHAKEGIDFFFVSRDSIKGKLKDIEKHYHLHANRSKRFVGFTKNQAKKIKYTFCLRV